MNQFLGVMIPTILLFVSGVVTMVVIDGWRRFQHRRTPLTRNLLRGPGHSLRLRIESLDDEISQSALGAMFGPVGIYAIYLSQVQFTDSIGERLLSLVLCFVIGVAIPIFCIVRLWRLMTDRRHCQLGLEGELMVAEELNLLMLEGCRVFHDIPIQYGNVDHVVVSQSGVYSVNTKMLGKLKTHDGKQEVTIDHSRNIIQFPDRVYSIPVSRLTTEAECLSKLLTSAIGEKIEVESMLALPGWFVKERIGRGPVFVFNPRNPKVFFVQERKVLTSQQIQRISHQLDQICRDVEPCAKPKLHWIDGK